MKKRLLTCIAFIAITPLLTQCASQNDVNQLNYQLRVVNKKIEDMKLGTVDKMQERQAVSSSQIEELRSEILKLRGQLEEMAHYNRQLTEQNKELELSQQENSQQLKEKLEKERSQLQIQNQEMQTKLAQQESELARQQEMLKTIQEARVREAKLKAEAAAREAERSRARANASNTAIENTKDNGVTIISPTKTKNVFTASAEAVESSAAVKDTAVSPPSTAPSQGQSTTDGLTAADKAYSDGNFKQAYSLYEEYARQNTSGDKSITAQFMMGECLFYQNEYDQAILQYQKIISAYQEHPRAASALLKQGMAFEKLSDIETAKIIYKKIATSYASSPEAATARERSSALN